jgi:hypothetical protein
MTALRKAETRKLIASLEAQGCRIEWAKSGDKRGPDGLGNVGRFPVKVWPPDKSRHFILLHQTVSSPNDVTVKRTEVQRAGLVWPFDDKRATKALHKAVANSRKENDSPMSTTESIAQAVQQGEPMRHLKVPAAVTNRTHPPTVESIARFQPYAAGMPETFWTDQLIKRLQHDDVQGYRGNGGSQRAMDMLDWLGYRVVEFKRNRGGFSYRWVKDPNAIVKPGVTREERAAKASRALLDFRAKQREGKVTPIRANGDPVREVTTNVGAALQDAIAEVEQKMSADLGQPVRVDQTPLLEEPKKLHHDRKQCASCGKWFTPEGFERHVAEFEHGVKKKAPAFTPDPDETLTPDFEGIEALRGGPVDLETATAIVSKADYDALEAMALETERKLAEAHGEVESLRRVHEQYRTDIAAREAEVVELRRERDELKDALKRSEDEVDVLELERRDDNSWLLDPNENLQVRTLREQAANMGVVIEVRARRA